MEATITILNEATAPTDGPFQAPEFHEDLVATIYVTGTAEEVMVEVRRQGEALLYEIGEKVATPADFRAAYPDGTLPDDDPDVEWVFNAWFDAYRVFPGTEREDEHLDVVDHDLADAIARAAAVAATIAIAAG